MFNMEVYISYSNGSVSNAFSILFNYLLALCADRSNGDNLGYSCSDLGTTSFCLSKSATS